jgi:hypothetical protein
VLARFPRFLLTLLMLVLPLQGFASAYMQGCEPVPHHTAPPQMAMGHATMAGCHESGAPHALPAQHDCKHCGVCALASALPVPAAALPVVVPAAAGYASLPTEPLSGFIPDGPERPPRSFLA